MVVVVPTAGRSLDHAAGQSMVKTLIEGELLLLLL